MCLTIPKKVISRKGNFFIVQLPDGTGQKVKSVVDLKIGDYCLTQQNVAVQKLEKKEAKKILKLLTNEKKGEKVA